MQNRNADMAFWEGVWLWVAEGVDNLRIALEKDRTMDMNNDPVLYSLPNHYIEISRILLEKCALHASNDV